MVAVVMSGLRLKEVFLFILDFQGDSNADVHFARFVPDVNLKSVSLSGGVTSFPLASKPRW
jgi:hypothetical protein